MNSLSNSLVARFVRRFLATVFLLSIAHVGYTNSGGVGPPTPPLNNSMPTTSCNQSGCHNPTTAIASTLTFIAIGGSAIRLVNDELFTARAQNERNFFAFQLTIDDTMTYTHAGFNLQTASGQVSVPSQHTEARIIGPSVTHNAPKSLNAGIVRWDQIIWQPSNALQTAGQGVSTLSLCVMPVNQSNSNQGDATANCQSRSIRYNGAPTAQPTSHQISVNSTIAITLRATDASNDTLTYTIITQPTNGSFSNVNPSGVITLTNNMPIVRYTANANYRGTDSFVFQVADAFSISTASVNIGIEQMVNINVLPNVALINTVSVQSGGRVQITLTGSDANLNDQLSYNIQEPPLTGVLQHGDITSPTTGMLVRGSSAITATATIEYIAANSTGRDSFVFVINDGTANSIPVQVSIDIVNSPVAASGGGGGCSVAITPKGLPAWLFLPLILALWRHRRKTNSVGDYPLAQLRIGKNNARNNQRPTDKKAAI